MFCRHCGREIPDGSIFCPYCGNGTAENYYPPYGAQNKQESVSTLALVGFILSFFVTIAGLICSIIAYNAAKRENDQKSRSFALAGIIISAVETGLALLIVILYFTLIASAIWGVYY